MFRRLSEISIEYLIQCVVHSKYSKCYLLFVVTFISLGTMKKHSRRLTLSRGPQILKGKINEPTVFFFFFLTDSSAVFDIYTEFALSFRKENISRPAL